MYSHLLDYLKSVSTVPNNTHSLDVSTMCLAEIKTLVSTHMQWMYFTLDTLKGISGWKDNAEFQNHHCWNWPECLLINFFVRLPLGDPSWNRTSFRSPLGIGGKCWLGTLSSSLLWWLWTRKVRKCWIEEKKKQNKERGIGKQIISLDMENIFRPICSGHSWKGC